MKIPENPLRVQSADEWRAWLQANHAREKETWLVIKKSSAAIAGVEYVQAVEEALCFGWIDGLTKSLDVQTFVQRFTPRRAGSTWSISNIQRVEKLRDQGKMAEAGLAAVREAQANGEWEAAIRREDVTNLPQDLLEALDKSPGAKAGFEKLTASQKKQLLHWISSAKTGATRQRRIDETVKKSGG